jgi:GNAT superfamily N-acetyltransferase
MSGTVQWRRISEQSARSIHEQKLVERAYLCARSASGMSFVWQGADDALAVLSPPGALYPQMPAALQIYSAGNRATALGAFDDLLPDIFVVYAPSTITVDGGQLYERLTAGSQLRLVCRRGSLTRVRRCETAHIIRATTARIKCDICGLYTPGESLFDPAFLERGPFFAAQAGGRCVGAIGTHVYAPDVGVALVGHFIVEPALRKLGVGTALLSAITRDIHRTCPFVLADVELDNETSLRLLQALGYEPAGKFTLAVWQRRKAGSNKSERRSE